MYLHPAIDGHTRLAYTDSLENEQAATAVAFLNRARDWFAKHRIVKIKRIISDNGGCYRSGTFAAAFNDAEHRSTRPSPAPRCARRQAARLCDTSTRQQRPVLIQLAWTDS